MVGRYTDPHMGAAAERHLAKRLAIDERTARALLRAAEHRRPRISAVSILTGLLIVPICTILLGCFIGPFAAALLGSDAYLVTIVLGIIAAIGVVVHMEAHSRADAAARAIEGARLRKECLHCGYDLRANLGDTGQPTCPECGATALHLPAPGSTLPLPRPR